MTASNPTVTMNIIDTMQRLGIGYCFEEEINTILETLVEGQPNDDLYTVALRFRLLRHNGFHTNTGILFSLNII